MRLSTKPQQFVSERCLVLAPHPDDETLGCGCLILQKRALNVPVHIIFASNGEGWYQDLRNHTAAEVGSIRKTEAAEASSRLGVSKDQLTFLELPDGYLSDYEEEIAQSIRSVVDKFQPEQLLIPCWADRHPDHLAIRRAAILFSEYHPDIKLVEYTIWFWRSHWKRNWFKLILKTSIFKQRFQAEKLPHPWPVIFRCKKNAEIKKHAFNAHTTQYRRPTDEINWPLMTEVDKGLPLKRMLSTREVYFRHK